MERYLVGYWECGGFHVCYTTDDYAQAQVWAGVELQIYERK